MSLNKRWLYLGTATLALLFLGLIYAWSIFRTPFSEIFPDWSVSQMSLTFTISMIFFCLGGFAGGLMSKKMSVRIRFLISAAMLFIGFFAVSMVDPAKPASSLIMLYIFYGIFGGGGVGVAYNTVIGTLNKWFPDKVGLASGIMLMGFGLGGLVLGSVVNGMIGSMGLLGVFRILGIVIAIVCAAAAFIIKAPSHSLSLLLFLRPAKQRFQDLIMPLRSILTTQQARCSGLQDSGSSHSGQYCSTRRVCWSSTALPISR